MNIAVQHRRGTTIQTSNFTGLSGEITIDTDKNTAVVHDGATSGGYPLIKASDISKTLASYTLITQALSADLVVLLRPVGNGTFTPYTISVINLVAALGG